MKEADGLTDRHVVDAITAAVLEVAPSARVHVVHDAGGVLVRAESDAFASWAHEERQNKVESHLGRDIAPLVHTWELLTPVEADWYGELTQAEGDRVPVWATALGQAQESSQELQPLTFASDLDEDLDSAPVVTFYSLKGGVGRSTALVAVAKRLSSEHGLTVVCVDMDLEAPGLDALFGIEDEVDSDQGAVSALLQYEFGEQVAVLKHLIPVDDSGRLYCMPAGRIDSAYAAQLRTLEPEIWYRERTNALHRLIDDVRESNLRPDVVLIDSRTGISPVAAPLLFDVSDMAVVCFHPHAQARAGTEMLTKALLGATTRRSAAGRSLTPEPRFVVSPMPPGSSATRLAERAKSWIEEWTAAADSQRIADTHGLSAEEITHTVPYNAEIAFTDTVTGARGQLAPYARIADWIVQIVPERVSAPTLHGRTSLSKKEALRQLSFSTGTAEILDHEEFLQDYVVTRQVNETSAPNVPLILGRKGTGKTALFRWLAAGKLSGWEPVLVTTPNQFSGRPAWSFGPDNYAAVGRALDQRGLDWGSFWQVLMAVAIHESYEPGRDLGTPHPALTDIGTGDFAVTQAVFNVLDDPMGPLQCGDWLQRVDAGTDRNLLLLFDGLDTAFGHSPAQRSRRSAAIAGLLTKEADLTSRLCGIRLKVFVRQDIWQGLRFENKSHFFGLSRRLQWEDREEYFKVVLKRAVRAPAFADVLAVIDPTLPTTEVAGWSPEQVAAAWGALVGERMRGERTAFTANWVWNRLADGNGDHSPRALLQLFAAALEWERNEEKRSGYDRSVLRPRSLALSLESVSDKALSALLDEEFQELRQAAEALREYGRTPVSEDALTGIEEDLVVLAQEAGLLEVLDSEGPERLFKVPDLYRWALGVTRRGPM
ncbi:hypothetical protein AB0M31_43030 [Streptomyces sp. NPDC051773]|uniref:KGGVGR-motif variant AAA ATPase n=1 Tax=Streptomyces sp. NPDC051773 TaxID=3156682 RepID=UPI003422BBDA